MPSWPPYDLSTFTEHLVMGALCGAGLYIEPRVRNRIRWRVFGLDSDEPTPKLVAEDWWFGRNGAFITMTAFLVNNMIRFHVNNVNGGMSPMVLLNASFFLLGVAFLYMNKWDVAVTRQKAAWIYPMAIGIVYPLFYPQIRHEERLFLLGTMGGDPLLGESLPSTHMLLRVLKSCTDVH